MKRAAVPLPTALFLLLAAGCAYAPLRSDATQPQPLPKELAEYYDYPVHAHQASVLLTARHSRYNEHLVRFPLSLPQGFEPTEPVVEFEWFSSNQPGRRGAIVFNPILGGDYPAERGICRFLARQGFHVALIHRKTLKISPEHPVSHMEHLLRQGIFRIRQVVDWMSENPDVDAARMGSFGISMGGMASVMAAAVEPRLSAHVVALAGGGLPDVLIASPDKLLAKPRAAYLSRNQMDIRALEQQLRQHVRTDPVLLAPYVDARRIFMFVALADRTIGRENALRLWRSLGKPSAVFMPFGHYTAYLSLPYLQHQSARFLKEKLGDSH